MLRLELIFDPTSNPPLKLNFPIGTNPNLMICLMAQIITGLSNAQVSGDSSSVIIPATTLPKVIGPS